MTPNSHGLATFLKRHGDRTIVLVAQDLAHWNVGEIAASATYAANANGYHLVSLDFHRSPDRERELLEALCNAHVAGVIFLWDHAEQNLDLYANLVRQRPCVQVLDAKPIPGLDFVGVDQYSGGLLAMRHLINLGYRQIGYVSLDASLLSVRDRRRAFDDALRCAGLPTQDNWILTLPYGLSEVDHERRIPQLRRFLSQDDLPKALYICADWVASELIECAHEMGLSVPEDFAVVGYDDALPYCLTRVPLTTIYMDLQQMGRIAVDRLLLQGRRGMHFEPSTILLSPTLVVRESSARTIATTERWAMVVRHLHDNFRGNITAHDMAELMGLDAHYFSNQFCRAFGRHFIDYLHELRLQYAAQLLITTDYTVESVARDAGFGSVNYFYRLFKRTYSVAPHAYRKAHTGQHDAGRAWTTDLGTTSTIQARNA